MSSIISVNKINKTYDTGHVALSDICLDIHKGEILALLGPNGAGKTTLISIICGLVNASSGQVMVSGYDNVIHYRKTRALIGLVPQEVSLGVFDIVWNSVNFTRGLFGKHPDHEYVSQLLKDLALYAKKDSQIRHLSGGMKRRVLIAKALSHQPQILFLDEPTAGVDVELRRDMWRIVKNLRDSGVTIILTTHYIEEAETIADRVAVINDGCMIAVDKKRNLMERLGQQQLILELSKPISRIPSSLKDFDIHMTADNKQLVHTYNIRGDDKVRNFLAAVNKTRLPIENLHSRKSSLEDIFVDMVKK